MRHLRYSLRQGRRREPLVAFHKNRMADIKRNPQAKYSEINRDTAHAGKPEPLQAASKPIAGAFCFTNKSP